MATKIRIQSDESDGMKPILSTAPTSDIYFDSRFYLFWVCPAILHELKNPISIEMENNSDRTLFLLRMAGIVLPPLSFWFLVVASTPFQELPAVALPRRQATAPKKSKKDTGVRTHTASHPKIQHINQRNGVCHGFCEKQKSAPNPNHHSVRLYPRVSTHGYSYFHPFRVFELRVDCTEPMP